MAKIKKSTKKFEKSRLKSTLEKRRKTQNFKKAIKQREDRKKIRRPAGVKKLVANDVDTVNNTTGDDSLALTNHKFKNMSVDDFFGGGFEKVGGDEFEIENSDNSLLGEDSDISDAGAIESAEEEDIDNTVPDAQRSRSHKKDLEMLKEKDPTFYKFLQENDAELLEFDESEDDDLYGDDEEDKEEGSSDGEDDNVEKEEATSEEMEEDDDEISKKISVSAKNVSTTDPKPVTNSLLQTWRNSLNKASSIRTLRRVLLAYRAAAHLNDESTDNTYAYKIESGATFNSLILLTLQFTPVVFDKHLPLMTDSKGREQNLTNLPKWQSLRSMVKSYLTNTLHLIKQLSDEKMLYFIVKESEKVSRFWGAFGKLGKEYIRVIFSLFGKSSSSRVRISCFLAIRNLCLAYPNSFLPLSLKAAYLTLVRNAKITNAHTLPNIRLMINLVVELYGLDETVSYLEGFGYVRQLAIHLRNSMGMKSKESYRAIYNWQYIHCIDFWANVIATYCDTSRISDQTESPLRPLLYPLVQIALGVIRLIPTSQYYPLRFHLIRTLVVLMQKTGAFIPLASYIFEVLDGSEMKRRAKTASIKPLSWEFHLKAPKGYLGSRVYQDGICEELYELLLEFYGCSVKSIAFPELVIPAIVQIKRHIKKSKNTKFSKQLQVLVSKFEQNSKYVELARASIEYSPSDTTKLATFLRNTTLEETPLGTFLSQHRKVKEQRAKVLATVKQDSSDEEDDNI